MVEIKVRKPDGTEGVIKAENEQEAQAKLARAKEIHLGLEVVPDAVGGGTSDPFTPTAQPMVQTGSGALDTAYDFARGIGRGVTFDWADEAAGAISSGLLNLTHTDEELAALERAGVDTSYEGARDRIREDQRLSENRSEHATLAGELVGGFAVPGVGAFRAGRALTQALPAVRPATGLALGGAGAGGLAAAGYSEKDTLSGIAQDAALGAGAGAVAAPVLGGVLGYVGRQAGRVGQGLVNRFAQDPDLASRMRIRQALEYSGLDDPAKVKVMQDHMGPEGVLADYSPMLTQEGQLVAKQPGRGMQLANEVVDQRLRGSSERLNRAARESLGAHQYGSWGDDYYKFIDDLTTGRQAQAAPAYKEAYGIRIRPNAEMVRISRTPTFQEAARQAQRKLADDIEVGAGYGPGMPDVDDGAISTAFADRILRRLNQMRNVHYRAGEFDDYRLVNNIYKSFRDEVYSQNPKLKEARGIFAGAKQLEEAADAGRNLLQGNKTYAEDVERMLSDFTEGERDAFTIGLIRGIKDKVLTAGETHDVGRRVFASRRVQEVLEEAFGDASFDDFYNAVKLESRFQETRNKVIGGSPTAPLRFAEEQGRPMEAAAGAEFGMQAWATSMLRRLVNETVEDASKLTAQDYEKMAELLFGDLDDAMIERIFTSSFGGRMKVGMGENPGAVAPALGITAAEQLGMGMPALNQ